MVRVLRKARGSFLRARARRLDRLNFFEFVRLIKVNDLRDYSQMRMGNKEGDGGYVISKMPEKYASVALSYGVNDDVSFETDLSNIYQNAAIHLFDHTVDPPPGLRPNHIFHRQGIAGIKSSNLDTLSSHIRSYAQGEQWIFLKMDVEGSEYDALLAADESDLKRLSQIALELHGISRFNKNLLPLLRRLSRVFILTHLHANNGSPIETWCGKSVPAVMEFTFVNRTICGPFSVTTKHFPTPLDAPNLSGLPEHDINHLMRI